MHLTFEVESSEMSPDVLNIRKHGSPGKTIVLTVICISYEPDVLDIIDVL